MPKNPDRPKIKYKPIKKPKLPPARIPPEEIRAARLAKSERKYKLTPGKVCTTILKERGLLTQVCRLLKTPRNTLVRYIERTPECVEALEHARSAMGDKAEAKLFELIEAGDVRCILYYLSTVHRARGYGLDRNGNGTNGGDNGGGGTPVFVETVNIVGIPSGTFLPKEAPVIEH
jgi:hypothetical protein